MAFSYAAKTQWLLLKGLLRLQVKEPLEPHYTA